MPKSSNQKLKLIYLMKIFWNGLMKRTVSPCRRLLMHSLRMI